MTQPDTNHLDDKTLKTARDALLAVCDLRVKAISPPGVKPVVEECLQYTKEEK